MKLQIIRIAERGLVNKERLHLSVLQDTNLSSYVVLLSRYFTPTSVANSNLISFWFPTQPVRAGDNVVLFSGAGTATSRKEANGNTNYFYYWGLGNTVWNVANDCAIIVEANDWQATPKGG